MKFFGFGSEKPRSPAVPEERMKMATRGNAGRETPVFPKPAEVQKTEELSDIEMQYNALTDGQKKALNDLVQGYLEGQSQHDAINRRNFENETGLDSDVVGELIIWKSERV